MAMGAETMEYPKTYGMEEQAMSDEDIENQIEAAGNVARVSPLDADFILILLLVAIPADILSIVLTIIALFTASIGWWIWLAIDIFISAPIYFWVKYRTDKIAKSKEERKMEIEQSLRQRANSLEEEALRLEKTLAKEGGEEAAKVAKTAAREGAEEASKSARLATRALSKVAVKLVGKSSARIILRIAGRCLLKMVPLVGCIPFWTITVLETIKEK